MTEQQIAIPMQPVRTFSVTSSDCFQIKADDGERKSSEQPTLIAKLKEPRNLKVCCLFRFLDLANIFRLMIFLSKSDSHSGLRFFGRRRPCDQLFVDTGGLLCGRTTLY